MYFMGSMPILIKDMIRMCSDTSNPTKPFLHSVVIVGCDETTITIKNSWGLGWGDYGKLHIPYDNLNQYAITSILMIDFIPEDDYNRDIGIVRPPEKVPSSVGGRKRNTRRRIRKKAAHDSRKRPKRGRSYIYKTVKRQRASKNCSGRSRMV